MKNDTWIIYIVVFATSMTTFMLISDGTFVGAIRGALAAVILDGLVVYWEEKRVTLKSDKQREYSRNMMWAGVGILFLFAGGYAIEYTMPSDTAKTIDIFGYQLVVTLAELVVYIATVMIGLWIVITLGVVLYLRGIDPETKKNIETTKAAQEREEEELRAYRIANKHTARELGTIKAMERYRGDLVALGKYTASEIALLLDEARDEIRRQTEVPQSGVMTANAANTSAVGSLYNKNTDPKGIGKG